MIQNESWIKVNQNLVAKAIGELTFEQILEPKSSNEGYILTLKSGVIYTFEGELSVWEYLKVDPSTLKRNGKTVENSGQFFIDSQAETNMNDIVLGNFLEEMHDTLFSDLKILGKQVDVSTLANWDGEKIQTVLNGHPKILLNKGRMGWGAQDLENFAPESENNFQLLWIGIRKELLDSKETNSLLSESFSEEELKSLSQRIDFNTYSIIPVHPWQWNRFIQIQFAGQISLGDIQPLGIMGDTYRPQISIRTLSNVTRPEKTDIKLPVSILNTSCIRGLPAASITKGQMVSESLKKLTQDDSFLNKAGTDVLLEKGGVAFVHPTYQAVKEAPYRYHEYLGAVWRESALSKVSLNEKAILTSSLFYQDSNRKTLVGELIKRSGMNAKEWMRDYFRVIILPLYHLQLEYGVGMVAHGQNIVLKLKDSRPVGMILKDFQGDLRLSNELPLQGQKYFKETGAHLTKLPPHYLIHDLITGHFITNLRFLSIAMQESDSLSEIEFYAILRDVITDYIQDKKIDPRQDLLAPLISRVLLNKVRFTIGYSDSAERPLPQLGRDLKNPLSVKGEKSFI